eukprot:CAMPEP_0185820132 /NCGR_PEP_ID=MMETSP1322-20130828/23227_1 /TAXON_ID=265543 /ORGANISM="Minutocellus polymorphus, Strain RCC2270" /LENGTH=44 /DNA_ID= /DNA_START= /DNA_END= /DNA_ORIENTATION=
MWGSLARSAASAASRTLEESGLPGADAAASALSNPKELLQKLGD